jgi:hypothetical protein
MEQQTYNGWTNYATWRVMLEIFDGLDPFEHFANSDGNFENVNLAECLKEHAEYLITDYKSETTLAQDYALAFLSYVNWHEIAEHMIEDYSEA